MTKTTGTKRPLPDRDVDGWAGANRSQIGVLNYGAYDVMEEYARYNTDPARAAFAGRWLTRLSPALEETWKPVYDLLVLVRDKELYRLPHFLDSKRTFSTFEEFFTSVMARPFKTWAEMEATYHLVERYCPQAFNEPLNEAKTQAERARVAAKNAETLNGHGGSRNGAGRPSSEAKTAAQKAQEQAPAAKETKSPKRAGIQVDIINLNSRPKGGTGLGYLASRLKRDAPEFHAALEAGKYPSVRAAAIAAGIVKVLTPLEQIRKLVAKLSTDERAQLAKELQAPKPETQPVRRHRKQTA